MKHEKRHGCCIPGKDTKKSTRLSASEDRVHVFCKPSLRLNAGTEGLYEKAYFADADACLGPGMSKHHHFEDLRQANAELLRYYRRHYAHELEWSLVRIMARDLSQMVPRFCHRLVVDQYSCLRQ